MKVILYFFAMHLSNLVDLIESYEVNLYDELKETSNKIYFKIVFDVLRLLDNTENEHICVYGYDYDLIEKSSFDDIHNTLYISDVYNTKEHSIIGYRKKETTSVKRFKSNFESDGVYCALLYDPKVIYIEHKDQFDSNKIIDLII